MKTGILIIALASSISLSSFGQASINFKTSLTKNPVGYSVDGTTVNAVPGTGDNPGVIPGFGTVFYEIYTAVVGTQLSLTDGHPNFTGWNATPVGPVNYVQDGVIATSTVVVPGVGGQPLAMEVVAYTGDLITPTLYGFSGMTINGANSVTVKGSNFTITDSTGALGWTNDTSDFIPGAPLPPDPPKLPGMIPQGVMGLGSIVLFSTPDASSTLSLLGATVLGLGMLRRKLQ